MRTPIQQVWSLLLESANAADFAIQMESTAVSAQDLSFVCSEIETASATLADADNLLRCGGYPADHALSIVAEKLRHALGLPFRASERAILIKEAYQDLAQMAEKVWTGGPASSLELSKDYWNRVYALVRRGLAIYEGFKGPSETRDLDLLNNQFLEFETDLKKLWQEGARDNDEPMKFPGDNLISWALLPIVGLRKRAVDTWAKDFMKSMEILCLFPSLLWNEDLTVQAST